ncbi:MAG: hypothetical protein V3R33_02730 [Anaerolineales bacterium]
METLSPKQDSHACPVPAAAFLAAALIGRGAALDISSEPGSFLL